MLNERARASCQVAEVKRGESPGGAALSHPFRPAREMEIYRHVLERNDGPLPDDNLKAVFREIISGSIAMQTPVTVSYLGPEGSFTHEAARSKFGGSVKYLPKRDLSDVFHSVQQGQGQYGVVPIENSLEGGVDESIDLFAEERVRVVSEVYVPIHHNFMTAHPDEPVRVIYTHPLAFGQCRRWLAIHHPTAERIESPSTSAAAKRAAGEPGSAAIASEMAAEIHGLKIIERAIEDKPDNITRFFVISLQESPPSGRDKTSVMLSTRHEPGALFEALVPFKEEGINLTRIESRPSKSVNWEYYFFVDMEGHTVDAAVRRALERIRGITRHLHVLGSYPAGDLTMPGAGPARP